MKKVLFLSLSGIGNYVVQAPTIAAAKKANPSWHITVWVAPRGTAALASNDANVDEVIEMPIKHSVVGHITQIMRLRRSHFDIAIVLAPGQLVKSALYMILAGIPKRIGMEYSLRGKQTDLFLTDAIPEPQEPTHDIERNLAMLNPLDISTSVHEPYAIAIPQSHIQQADSIITSLSIPSDRQIIGIHAGSAPDIMYKRWPLDYFISLSKQLITNHNVYILVFGGDDEEEDKERLVSAIQREIPNSVASITGDLLVVAAVMQHCTSFVSNDSGLMHLAAAAGVRTLGLFGPTDEARTGPRGNMSETIRAAGTTPIYSPKDIPLLDKESHASMQAISPELVLSRLALHL